MPVALVTLSTPDQVNALDVSGSEGGAEAAQPEESGRGVSHVEVRRPGRGVDIVAAPGRL
jgi:hypothetical protein